MRIRLELILANALILLAYGYNHHAHAETMMNERYIIETNVTQAQNKPKITPKTQSQKSQGGRLQFNVSDISIEFGDIVAGEPLIRDVTIQAHSTTNSLVFLGADSLLKDSQTGLEIAPTTCDSGNCTNSSPAVWENPLTYGYGYRCSSKLKNSCVMPFKRDDYIQMSDLSKKNPLLPLASISKNELNTIKTTYKVNVPQTHSQGLFVNSLKLIMLPQL
jgi:hypothetical protein